MVGLGCHFDVGGGGVGGGPGLDVSVGLKIERHYAISIACP